MAGKEIDRILDIEQETGSSTCGVRRHPPDIYLIFQTLSTEKHGVPHLETSTKSPSSLRQMLSSWMSSAALALLGLGDGTYHGGRVLWTRRVARSQAGSMAPVLITVVMLRMKRAFEPSAESKTDLPTSIGW